jgi:predicted nuclease of predicted toxin-antitoxin system
MKFLIDMNLSPRWFGILQAEGWDSVHWSQVGIASAPDHELMQWALGEQRIVLTHDLDYGAMLAATKATGPSVVQVRTQDVRPETLAPLLIPTLRQYESELEAGALLIVDEAKLRVRLLPLAGKSGP